MKVDNGILDDDREILALHFDDEAGSCFTLGDIAGITKIEAYGEPSEHCYVPWFRLYNENNEIVQRIPASRVRVVYKT